MAFLDGQADPGTHPGTIPGTIQRAHILSPLKQGTKNVWKSDKSWEPEKIWKFEFETLNSKFEMA